MIELGSGYLRDLGLSNNELKVETKEEMKIWEGFLKSFERCSMMKRLNLGGSPLGSFGLELLAKVYIEGPLEVEVRETHKDHVHILVTTDSRTDLSVQRREESDPCMRGLRLIPYLILARIDLTSSAVIHLASMLTLKQSRLTLRSYLPDNARRHSAESPWFL